MESSDRSRGARPRPPRPQIPHPAPQTQHLSRIKASRDEAFLYIEQGLVCDENAQTEQAQILYVKGLAAIDNTVSEYQAALRAGVCTGQEWDKVKNMITTMQQTKTRIRDRVDEMSRTDQAVIRALHDPPPSYQQSLSPSSIDDLEDGLISQGQGHLSGDSAMELFKISEGVQIFFITGDGFVSAPSYPSGLAIYKFDQQLAGDPSRPPAFLKIGSWTYPLLPGQSPALHATYGAYMFPDVTAPHPGASVGVLLPDSASEQEKLHFKNLLNELTDYHDQTATPAQTSNERPTDLTSTEHDQDTTSDKISDGIVTAAGWLATGLTKGAQQASHLMRRGSESLRQHITPQQQPTHIDSRYQTGAEYARKATGCAVYVTGFVINKLGQGTAALAKELAPHVRAGGEKVLPTSFTKKDPSGRSTMDHIGTVAQGGLKGFGTVHLALEGAARTLLTSLSEETSSVVKHKYGDDAGKLAGNAVGAGANAVLAVGMVNNMGAKMVARSAAKHYMREQAQEPGESKEKTEDSKQKRANLQDKADMDEQIYMSKQDIPPKKQQSMARGDSVHGTHTTNNGTHNGVSSRTSSGAANPRPARSLYPPGTAPVLPAGTAPMKSPP